MSVQFLMSPKIKLGLTAMSSQFITKLIKIHSLEKVNVPTKFHGNLFNRPICSYSLVMAPNKKCYPADVAG